MSNEEIRQRIAYLVEHGGLYDDPLGDLRRWLRRIGIGVSLVLCIVTANFLTHVLF
jgi:hypothetical protein